MPFSLRTLFLGESPKSRLYSRLNWVTLSYPTAYADSVTELPLRRSRLASSSRSLFWYCRGLSVVT